MEDETRCMLRASMLSHTLPYPLVCGCAWDEECRFDFAQWRFANTARIELIQPNPDQPEGDKKRNFLVRFLKDNGPGIHHITFLVANFEQRVKKARDMGYNVVGVSTASATWHESFLHPKNPGLGVVVQIAQSFDPSTDVSYFSQYYPDAPSIPTGKDNPFAILAIRTIAHSMDAAKKLWVELLEGTVMPHSDTEARFSWRNSPLQVHVTIDPSAPEGPTAIEISNSINDNGDNNSGSESTKQLSSAAAIVLPPFLEALGAKFVAPVSHTNKHSHATSQARL
eukprot:TRINITY_DN4669_c0_g1_i2.p1 TRINITY_DN4669_c0_g1~~TRINITY_DN4669_c0_g1_i2.p1  ORF type:complete len:282 (+),score=48.80 TRINITY_DN4669_c0_g1_i2:129-974(+)